MQGLFMWESCICQGKRSKGNVAWLLLAVQHCAATSWVNFWIKWEWKILFLDPMCLISKPGQLAPDTDNGKVMTQFSLTTKTENINFVRNWGIVLRWETCFWMWHFNRNGHCLFGTGHSQKVLKPSHWMAISPCHQTKVRAAGAKPDMESHEWKTKTPGMKLVSFPSVELWNGSAVAAAACINGHHHFAPCSKPMSGPCLWLEEKLLDILKWQQIHNAIAPFPASPVLGPTTTKNRKSSESLAPELRLENPKQKWLQTQQSGDQLSKQSCQHHPLKKDEFHVCEWLFHRPKT